MRYKARSHDPHRRLHRPDPRKSWRFNQPVQRLQNLMITANVCMWWAPMVLFDSMGEGMIVNFDGSIIAPAPPGASTISSPPNPPDLVRRARGKFFSLCVENNIYQLWHPLAMRRERRRDGLSVHVQA